jgi:hypothetical protein
MQVDFNDLRTFDYTQGAIHLWVFKNSSSLRKFSASFVQTDDNLNALLRNVIRSEIARIIEFSPYTYLAETNENSCLAMPLAASDFGLLKVQLDRPEPECSAQSIRDLKGADGYAVKFINNNQTIYAVKRSTSTWKTSYPKRYINIIFKNGELSAAEDNGFSIERTFDFYSLNTSVFIASKRAFESAMKHSAAYAQAFVGLRQSPIFSALFTDLQPLVAYVGTNSIQLRRMALIEHKELFIRPNFLQSLQRVSAARGWNLNFDPTTNQLVPCDQTARTILQVLLDHRLMSEVTDHIYDVPDATLV